MYEHDRLFIGGEWLASAGDATLEVVSPSTEEVVGRVPDPVPEDIDRAVDAARRAFDVGPWRWLEIEERAEILGRALAALEPRVQDIARTITTEMGAPISSTVGGHAEWGLVSGRMILGDARALWVEELRQGRWPALVRREPVGVVAAVAPWNGPWSMAIAKVVAPLAVGCSVVFKPAPETPLDAYYLADALCDVGLPEGVVSIVAGGRALGEHLVSHPGVDKVSFTGSTAAGRRVAALCGEGLKRVQLELGGKSAAIVLGDADLDKALPWLQAGAFMNSGQVCAATSRVLAHRSRYDEVVDRLAAAADTMRVGDPFEPETELGPLVAARQRERVEGYIAVAKGEGARLVTGGRRPPGLARGWYVEPTVFASVDNGMRVAQEEIFGPVVVVIPFDADDEALRIANESVYGLHGAVFTEDEERAIEIACRVRTGTFSINRFQMNTAAPFGGMKCSGIGREYGPEGLAAFLEHKTVNLSRDLNARLVAERSAVAAAPRHRGLE